MKKMDDISKSYFGPRVSDGAGVFVTGFVFMFIAQIVVIIAASLAGIDVSNMPYWFNWIVMIVNQLTFVGAVAAYGAVAKKPLIAESRIKNKLNYKQALIIIVITIASIMAFLPLANGFVELIELITGEQPTVNISIGSTWWQILINFLILSIFPAIGEEMLFRAGVARGLKRKGYVFAIIMSGFMFSIFHGNAAQTVHQFLVGMVMAYVYFVTGSFWGTALCHFANNGMAIILELIAQNINMQLPLGAEIAMWVCISIAGFVCLYFLLRYLMRISKQIKGIEVTADKMAWAKDLKNAFTLSGIKDNYFRLENSLKQLFDDPCDGIDVNGDIATQEESAVAPQGESEQTQMDKLLQEANLQTIKKRKRFDMYTLAAAIGIALAVWIINLLS